MLPLQHKKGPHAVVLSGPGRKPKLYTFRDKAQALQYVKAHRAHSRDGMWASYWGKVPIYGKLARTRFTTTTRSR
jgi:hypothetical protein